MACSKIMFANRKLIADDPMMEAIHTINWKRPIRNRMAVTALTKESICQEACAKSNGSSSQCAPKVVPTKGSPPSPSPTTPTSTSAVVASTTAKRPEGHRAPLHPSQNVRECFDLERVDLCNLVESAHRSLDWGRSLHLNAEKHLKSGKKRCWKTWQTKTRESFIFLWRPQRVVWRWTCSEKVLKLCFWDVFSLGRQAVNCEHWEDKLGKTVHSVFDLRKTTLAVVIMQLTDNFNRFWVVSGVHDETLPISIYGAWRKIKLWQPSYWTILAAVWKVLSTASQEKLHICCDTFWYWANPKLVHPNCVCQSTWFKSKFLKHLGQGTAKFVYFMW